MKRTVFLLSDHAVKMGRKKIIGIWRRWENLAPGIQYVEKQSIKVNIDLDGTDVNVLPPAGSISGPLNGPNYSKISTIISSTSHLSITYDRFFNHQQDNRPRQLNRQAQIGGYACHPFTDTVIRR